MGTSYKQKLDGGTPIGKRLLITSIYFLQAVIAYALMLAAMSYNGGVFIVLIVGLAIGNFITSYLNLKREVNSFNDNDELGEAELQRSGYKTKGGANKKANELAL